MLFNSWEFIFAFLPVTLIGFFALGRFGGERLAIAWLVIASLFYYGWWNPKYLVLISFSMLFNYTLGLMVTAANKSDKGILAGTLLTFGIAINLGLIGYFKYANFFVDTINELTNAKWYLMHIVLPIGISFFTFQQIAYLVDARRGETQEHNFLNYCLFIAFFPQLIAGPIVHHKEMLPQFSQAKTFIPQLENLGIGATIFCIGLFKKVIIADNLALTATPVFQDTEPGLELHFFQSMEGTIAFTLQLYFDFSGYSDMAIGLGRMFGIRLPLNFHSPYKATSIIDFWRRWHMTLSRFLRDYIYIPLGGNRQGPTRRYANLMITMLLGGLWHGAGWTFVFWGGLHGLYLVVNQAWRRIRGRPINQWWSRLIARTVTFFFVALAWVFFRAESFGGALAVLDGMRNLPYSISGTLGPVEDLLVMLGVRFDGPAISARHLKDITWLVFWLGVLWLLPNTQQWLARFEPAHNHPPRWQSRDELPAWLFFGSGFSWRPSITWAVYIGLLLAMSLLSLSEVTEFLYFQF